MPQPPNQSSPARLTLADIAHMAGVSRQVVSAVMGVTQGSVRYSPQTRRRVMDIVRKTNFRPNRTAQNLVKNRHGALGLLVTNFGNIHDQALRVMLYEAHRFGQVLTLDVVQPDDEAEPLFVREDSVDGVVVFEDIDTATLRAITRVGLPCVRVNTNVRHLPGCIVYREAAAMRTAVNHCVSIGRTRIGCLVEPSDHYSMRVRVKGLEQACAKQGIAAPLVCSLSESFTVRRQSERAHDELRHFLQAHPALDVVVLTVDHLAPVFYRVCAQLKRRIPQDIAVIGINNSPIAQAVLPALTSLYVRPGEVGVEAIRLLNRLIRDPGQRAKPLRLDYQLEIRPSTMPHQS